jgi:hypothetical protein
MAKLGQTSITNLQFWVGTLAVLAALGVGIWFAIPGPDTRHRLVSPSGRVVLDIGERCEQGTCARVIVSEETPTDGVTQRFGCAVPLTEQRPMLVTAQATWSADEGSVDIDYADAAGVGGTFTLVLGRDCTQAD